MIRIGNIYSPVEGGKPLRTLAAQKLGVNPEDVTGIQIRKRSIDARHQAVRFCYTLDVRLRGDESKAASRTPGASVIEEIPEPPLKPGDIPLRHRPVIIGAGPAGLFAALLLAEYGYRPLILERGPAIDARDAAVDAFHKTGKLDTEANIAYGEGGAGAYSDGKLTTGIGSALVHKALDTFVKFGAPEDILYDAKPHIGSDLLKRVIKSMRAHIISLGGGFEFGCRVDDILQSGGSAAGVVAGGRTIDAGVIVLAAGHSARDTYRMLLQRGAAMQRKAFAMGLRIEHPREYIDNLVYKNLAGHAALGAAAYSVKARTEGGNVFSFCMCPGGWVVNSSSETGMLCVNGMSDRARDAANSNSAIVTVLSPDEFGEGDELAGLRLQQKYEALAYRAGGGGYLAPAQRLSDYLQGRVSGSFDEVAPSIRPGAYPADLDKLLPHDVSSRLKCAIPKLEASLRGFAKGPAVLTGIEARTSSPVRILRGADGCSESIAGLYPAGEGAGYAGGIMSSAVDGMGVARYIIEKYKFKEG